MLAASIAESVLACLFLLPGVVCQASEEEIAAATDVIFLPWSVRLRRGASPNAAKLCWWHEYRDDFLKHSYRQCCCAGPTQSLQCWDGDTSEGPPRACCHYRYGPGTTCFPLHGRVRLEFPGLPVLSARLKPSKYEYEPYFAALLTQGHLLEPFLEAPVGRQKLRAVDLGAGKGLDSVILSKMGHLVVAMEQDPQELQLIDTNKKLNNVSFEVVPADLTETETTAARLLAASGGAAFDLIVANFLAYLPPAVFLKVLDLVERIGTPDFVWLWPCGKEEFDPDDEQRPNRDQATLRFEAVDVLTFGNVGNPFEAKVQLGNLRICALQRRGRPPGAWRYRWPRARAARVLSASAACAPPLWRCSPEGLLFQALKDERLGPRFMQS
ncbi:unnamed protein product [Symbiodinium necroappetens]|uniref:Methyltransferase domain-containing protein n=1 Tax=Symbiodinium necroappetens TaxID=1628268 RepID=A0A812QIP9_9DINO|nr:unnamed protein product [Symbiodinium necroappetens]